MLSICIVCLIAIQGSTLISGGDTNIIGSQVTGNKDVVDIGGNFTIQSLQDTTGQEKSEEKV